MSDVKSFNEQVIEEFRANGGVVGGPMEGMPLLLLHTVGAKSGQPRVNPLAYLEDGDRLVIIASFAGAPKHPPWYHNLVANPEVTVEVGTEKYEALATVVGEPERTELYGKVAAAMPVFDEYQSRTERVIPVVVLTRR
jgi:deazaflavin-dependent oxidoreductase (nitroreductase family)